MENYPKVLHQNLQRYQMTVVYTGNQVNIVSIA